MYIHVYDMSIHTIYHVQYILQAHVVADAFVPLGVWNGSQKIDIV